MRIFIERPIVILLCLISNACLLVGQSDKSNDSEKSNSVSESLVGKNKELSSNHRLFQSDQFLIQESRLNELEQSVEARLEADMEAIYLDRLKSNTTNTEAYSLKTILEGFGEPVGQIVDGKREGLWLFNSNANLVKGYYLNDKMNGLWQYFYEKGKIRMEGEYANDLLNGPWTYYYIDGEIKRIINWKEGLMNGTSKSYSSSGVLRELLNYDSGSLLGLCERYSDDGLKIEEGTYSGGLKQGLWNVYGVYGNKVKLETYKSGDLDGPFELYGSNGKLRVKGYYKSNKRAGEWVFYYTTGLPAIKGSYLNDKKTGKWIYIGGALPYYRQGTFDAGDLVDDWSYFME